MNLRQLLDWRVFVGCLAVSFALAWAVQWLFEINYWIAWGIIMFAWVGVGIATFFDDDKPTVSAASEDRKDSTGV